MGIKFIEPTKEAIEIIAADMRQADIDEIWASHHYTPVEALMEGWKDSYLSAIVTIEDEPCVMLGLVIHDILSGSGVPWLLGTENVLKHKREFVRQVPAVIDMMLDICPKLTNFVHVENRASVRWLKRIGFILDDPLPYGCENELFHRFHLERSY